MQSVPVLARQRQLCLQLSRYYPLYTTSPLQDVFLPRPLRDLLPELSSYGPAVQLGGYSATWPRLTKLFGRLFEGQLKVWQRAAVGSSELGDEVTERAAQIQGETDNIYRPPHHELPQD